MEVLEENHYVEVFEGKPKGTPLVFYWGVSPSHLVVNCTWVPFGHHLSGDLCHQAFGEVLQAWNFIHSHLLAAFARVFTWFQRTLLRILM